MGLAQHSATRLQQHGLYTVILCRFDFWRPAGTANSHTSSSKVSRGHCESFVQKCRLFGAKPTISRQLRPSHSWTCYAQQPNVWIFGYPFTLMEFVCSKQSAKKDYHGLAAIIFNFTRSITRWIYDDTIFQLDHQFISRQTVEGFFRQCSSLDFHQDISHWS